MKIILPTLHPAQIQIVDNPGRFKVVAAGRRFGKGLLAVTESFKRGIGGEKCRWISPSYASDSFQAGWSIAENLAHQIPGVEVEVQRRTFNFSALGGEWFQFKTAEEPDSLRGEGVDFAVFDEAAHIQKLQEIWEQAVRPSLLDRRGDTWFVSTPKGHNYFATLFNKGRDKEPGWASFRFSSFDNPFLDRAEIEALKASLPALVARQEIEAEFVQLAGAMFRRDMIHVLDNIPSGIQWVRSWDLACTTRTSSDYTAGAKVGMTDDGTIVVGHMIHLKGEMPEVLRTIAAPAKLDGENVKQGIETVGTQTSALQMLLADPLLACFTFAPLPVAGDKITRSLPLVARAEQGKLAIVRGSWNTPCVDELCSFPESEHDDMVDAVTGALPLVASVATPFYYSTVAVASRRHHSRRFGRERRDTQLFM